MKASLFIAVETYADKRLPVVKYAEADAREFATVLDQHGFESDCRELLIDQQATKTSIESAVRTTLKRLTKDDTLFVHYVGHGFAKIGDGNYMTCFDTRLADAENTSVGISWLVQQFEQSKCGRVVMFLDSNHGGPLAGEETRSIRGELDERDLKEVFESAERCVCFVSCKEGEKSARGSSLRHGIWTYHVSQAFDGRHLSALDGTRLTASSLQNYLSSVVPTTLRIINPQATQTPSMYGSNCNDLQLADCAGIVARRKTEKNDKAGQLRDAILIVKSVESVTSLTGFKKSKGHFVPEQHNNGAHAFINALASAEIAEDVESIRAALKREFRFKRREVTVENHGEGAATITTPFFNYNISVGQDHEDPQCVLRSRSVDAIIDPRKVLSDEFEAVFADVFDTVELSLHNDADLDELIDVIEALAGDEINVAYDEDDDVSQCVLTLKGYSVTIEVTKRTFSVVQPWPRPPKLLLQSLFEVQQALTQKHNVLAIPFQ